MTTAVTLPAPARMLPPGRIAQVWLGSGRFTRAGLEAFAAKARGLGFAGIALHAGPRGVVRHWVTLSPIVTRQGLACYAAMGLDGTRDEDGSELTPEEKGECLATVALRPDCAGVLIDMEGRYDLGKRPEAARVLARFRHLAPEALAVDQPWFACLSHRGFPWDETAQYVDVRAPQVYVNDFKSRGSSRYASIAMWHEHDWQVMEMDQRSRGVPVRPRVWTIQGYAWADIMPDLVACLLERPTLIVWGEPFPDAAFERGCRAVEALRLLRFTGPGAVRAFQSSLAGQRARLTADNRCGPLTMAALGVP